MKFKKHIKRFKSLYEYLSIALIAGSLYFTGYHTEVIGFMQSLVLKTGLFKPDLEVNDSHKIDLDFKLTDIEGNSLESPSLEGKTVFINFWATWCPPCVAELPDLIKMYETLKNEENMVFLFINLDKDLKKATKFIERKNLKIPIYRIESGLPELLDFQSIPTTFVISKSGELVLKHEGMGQFNTEGFIAFLKRN